MVCRSFFYYIKNMYREYNSNPLGKRTGDCVIRAVAKVTGQDWEQAYINIAALGYEMADMPSTNAVWGAHLRGVGFVREVIPNTCPDCYTIRNFCADHPSGTFAVATGSHVVAVVDGDYYDTWDSGDEIPIYYFRR